MAHARRWEWSWAVAPTSSLLFPHPLHTADQKVSAGLSTKCLPSELVVLFLSISEVDHGHQQLVLDGQACQWREGRGPLVALEKLDASLEDFHGESGRFRPWARLRRWLQTQDPLECRRHRVQFGLIIWVEYRSCSVGVALFLCVVLTGQHVCSRGRTHQHTLANRVRYRAGHLQTRDETFGGGKQLSFLCHARSSVIASAFHEIRT